MSTIRNKINRVALCDGLGQGLMAVLVLLYSIFTRNFAEIHVTMPFLNIPVFVGEGVLFFCLSLFLLKGKWDRFQNKKYTALLIFFYLWVMMKSLIGYFQFGPLSFRNAALFYYSIFAVFVYDFTRNSTELSPPKLIFLNLGLFALLFTNAISDYYYYLFIGIMVISGLSLKNKSARVIILLLSLVAIIKTNFLFVSSRSHLVGMIFAFIFLILFVISQTPIRYRSFRIMLAVCLFVILCAGFYKFADRNAIKSLLNFSRLRDLYLEYDAEIKQKEPFYKSKEIEVKLFKPESPQNIGAVTGEGKVLPLNQVTRVEQGEDSLISRISQPPKKKGQRHDEEMHKGAESEANRYRSLDTANINTLFRVFIWRDMLAELRAGKPFWGVSFGKPQRSNSLEILGWGDVERLKVGWITPHNSFFHMLYRGGIIGLGYALVIFILISRMTRTFYFHQSISGAILTSILIYWCALANFLVFLELPYQAIPFWCVFGISLAYAEKLNDLPLAVKKQ